MNLADLATKGTSEIIKEGTVMVDNMTGNGAALGAANRSQQPMPWGVRTGPGVWGGVTTVTPDMARKILQSNTGNRKIRPAKVAQYARAMAEGRWLLHGQAVQISSTGELIDGQHRMLAVIEAGVDVDMMIAFGVDPRARAVVDRGATRTIGDVFTISGLANRHETAAVLRLLYLYDRQLMRQHEKTYPDADEMVELYHQYPSLDESIHRGFALQLVMTRTTGTFLHYILKRVDRAKAEEFVDAIRSGVGLADRDPRLVLRNRLLVLRRARRKAPAVELAAISVKAWNAWRSGTVFTKVFWRGTTQDWKAYRQNGKKMPEDFPTAI